MIFVTIAMAINNSQEEAFIEPNLSISKMMTLEETVVVIVM